MALQSTPYAVPLGAVGLVFVAFAAYLVRRPSHRRTRGTWLAAALLAGMAGWLLTYAGTLSFASRPGKLLFARLQYVGPATVPPLWFAYVVTYTGHGDLLDRRRAAALAAPPAAVFALALAYPATELLWTSASLVDAGSWTALVVTHGPAFYAYQVYVYALFAATMWLLVRYYRRAPGVYRSQTLALLAGALVPGVVGLVYVAGLSPVPELDLPATSLVFTAGAVAWSVTRHDLFTLAPVAWETAVAQLDDPVFVVDTEDRVVAANDAGRSFADVSVGDPASDALSDLSADAFWREPGEHELDATRGDDHHVYEVTVTPVERNDVHLGNVVVLRDVTDRHRREERLEEFASVVSHDLRNPLNVARGHLELGRETGDDDHFAEADDALDRMERIIDDLLTLAREGDVDPDGERQSLASAARTAWSAVDTMDADATLDVRDDRTLVADETGLLRVLENLFRNSVEHADGAVTVSVGTLEDRDGFYVADDGPGIPDGERDQVFEHGYTTSEDGTGFGLAIVEEVAAAHDWRVDVADSDAGGARFEFTVR